MHEQYPVINEENKQILISGCAHNGILNILDRYREIYGMDPDKELLETICFDGFVLCRDSDRSYFGYC